MRHFLRAASGLAIVAGAFTILPAATAAAADLIFITSGACDSGVNVLTMEIIDDDPNSTTTAQIIHYDGVNETVVTEGEFSSPNLLTISANGPSGLRVVQQGGEVLHDSGLLDPCSEAPADEPTSTEDPVTSGDLTFTLSAACDQDGLTLSLRVQNSGQPLQIEGLISTFSGSMSQQAVVGDRTFTTTAGYYGSASISVRIAGEYVYQSGIRTATDADHCGIPMPAIPSDLQFEIDAACGADLALVTVTVHGQDIDVEVEASYASQATDHLTGDGPIQTSFSVAYGKMFTVAARDAFGRFVWESGYLITTPGGCLSPMVDASIQVRCSAGQPQAVVLLTSHLPVSTEFTIELWVNDDEHHANPDLGQGETWEHIVPIATGDDVDASVDFVYDDRDFQPAYAEDLVGPDCSQPTDTVPGDDQGSGGGSPTTAPSRGLPTTGRASGTVTLFGLGLLLAGAALMAATRRRTA